MFAIIPLSNMTPEIIVMIENFSVFYKSRPFKVNFARNLHRWQQWLVLIAWFGEKSSYVAIPLTSYI